MRLFRFGSLAFFVAVVAGCQPPERAVLIDVHTQADLEDLRITVISLDSAYRWEEPMRHVRRTAEDIDADPVRVAVILGGASYVMVHLDGTTPDGGHVVATRCYQVDGVIHDEVLLFGPLGELDIDGDGFVADPASICREPGPDGRLAQSCDADLYVCPAERASDCNETDASIHPGAAAVCLDGVDQDCDGTDEPCADQDGDGVDACPADPTGPCDCNDSIPSINPRAEDVCLDGIDQDCDGRDACCDADMDGSERCANGLPDCDDGNAAIPGTEVCDSVDNNCNGAVDELDECRGPDLDSDGVAACGREAPGDPCDCNDCDPSIHEGAEERCGPRVDPGTPGNGIDDDCDGMIDEGCRADDADGDGVEAARDCNDNDPLFFPPTGGRTPIEYCMDTLANDCIPTDAATSCDGDTDGDGYLEPAECEGNAAIHPGAAETCNGVDDDCDGLVDEGLSNGTTGCAAAVSLDFNGDVTNCGGCRVVCNGQTANQCVAGVCGCQWNAGGAECASTDTCCPSIGCADLQNDPANCGVCGNACGAGETCSAGRCVCGSTTAGVGLDACPETGGGLEANVCCGGSCRDVTSDDAACGQCDLACGPNSHCQDRLCECDAPSGGVRWEDCNNDRRNVGNDGCEINTLGVDTTHCGSCTNICQNGNATWRCNAGSCEPTGCSGGFQNCDSIASNGCETDLTRPATCGACAPTGTCGANEGCSGGQCTCGAARGAAGTGAVCRGATPNCCASGCVDLQTDEANCGGCGVVCGAGETCNAGRCTCGSDVGGVGGGEICVGALLGDTCCPSTGGCSNTSNDTANCGGCGIACALGERCTGTCGPQCGNGILTAGESCDDNNTAIGDGCSGTCSVETGWTCSGAPSSCMPICGDGRILGGEACDDRNTTNNDGCSSSCTVELGWTCSGSTSTCAPVCGDGRVVGGEGCDDRNTANNDGCSSSCAVETGWSCMGIPSTCSTICGDGRVIGGEACDDGGRMSSDGCSSSCTVEAGWRCNGASPTVCVMMRCGDGVRDPGEACDDGGTAGGDGCSSSCAVETGWTCNAMSPTTCSPICGDGMRVGSESCDDGYRDACGTCNATCTGAGTGSTCGDGVVCAETEACDDYNNNSCGTCNNNCTMTRSGGNCPMGTGCGTGADCMSGMCNSHVCG